VNVLQNALMVLIVVVLGAMPYTNSKTAPIQMDLSIWDAIWISLIEILKEGSLLRKLLANAILMLKAKTKSTLLCKIPILVG
jgi:hypothetical protein